MADICDITEAAVTEGMTGEQRTAVLQALYEVPAPGTDPRLYRLHRALKVAP